MRYVWVAAMVFAGMAGCSDGAAPPDDEGSLAVRDVETRSDTGAISGVVVSETISPIDGAVVVLQGTGRNATTDATGQFVFEDLAPGAYFLSATAPEFLPTQASVEVRAGEVTKPKILLPADRSPKPYHVTSHFNGYMVVSDFYGVWILTTTIGNNALCECIFEVASDPDVQTVVLEAIWETSVPRSDHQLYWEIYNDSGYGSYWSESPTLWHQSGEGYADDATEWTIQVSSDLVPDVEQEFEVFATMFYVGTAPEGWSIIAGTP